MAGERTACPSYSRIDVQINKEMRVRGQHLEIYAGVDNVLNRSNFLSYTWMPRSTSVGNSMPVGTLRQPPIFPNFGLRVIVR